MNFGKLLLGALTGGLSYLFNGAGKAGAQASNALNAESGFSDDPDKMYKTMADIYGQDQADVIMEEFKRAQASQDENAARGFMNKYNTPYSSTVSDGSAVGDWLAKNTGSRLTTAEEQANAYSTGERIASQDFTHNEAVDARMWQQYVEENKYGWSTQSMQDAGLNPAMMYGGGNLVGTQATGAQGSSSPARSVSPSNANLDISGIMGMMMNLARLPKELADLKAGINEKNAAAEKARAEASAATYNAETNRMNAFTNQQNAFANMWNANTNERQVAVSEAKLQLESALTKSNIEVNDATINELAEKVAYIAKERELLPKYLAVAEKNANANQLQAVAAYRSADAAVQNAATNQERAQYEEQLMWSETMLNELAYSAKSIELQYLPETLQERINLMKSQGYYFNQRGELCDKEGKLVQAKVAREYVGLACDVARTTCQVVGTVATGGAGGAFVQGGHSDAGGVLFGVDNQTYGSYGSF